MRGFLWERIEGFFRGKHRIKRGFYMRKYIIKRLLIGILIVIFGALVVYAVVRCLPSSYVETMARQRAAASRTMSYQQMLARLNHLYGMDCSIPVGYVKWLGSAIQGDFGESWKWGGTVVAKFKSVIGYSVLLNSITMIVQCGIGIPLGILAARKQYSKVDYAVTIFALMGVSLPSFFLASILKFVFAVKLKLVDAEGLVGRYYNQLSPMGKVGDIAQHMILPVIVLCMLSIGGLMRYTRTNMLEVLNADYIRTARAKGLPEKAVINHHAFRNTLIPLVTFLSYLLPSMFGGSMITEQLFSIPGIGQAFFQSTKEGDIPFIMFYSLFIIVLTQISLLIADLVYAAVDPRVRIS